MLSYDDQMFEFCEARAEHDGIYAVAFAVLMLAREHRTLQQHLTFNGGAGCPGVLEKIAIGVNDVAKALDGISDSLDRES